ncbi:MAG TPA: alkaline phosphatase family protein, partial [Gemmatimonadaceae bacterium]|nr:alkaline phosphatase family protein [Gemmatimonadaceae bacterium]
MNENSHHPSAVSRRLLAVALFLGACTSVSHAPAPANSTIGKINHIVVIYLENRSFDNLYGEFPGADGIVGLTPEKYRQVDSTGAAYVTLPQAPDSKLPSTIPNAPFPIEDYIPSNAPTRDLVHRFYQEQLQINDGRMNRFVVVSDAKGLTMGHYHTAALPLAAEARNYALADHFFHGAFGGSFFNHIYLISTAAPVFPNAPAAIRAKLDANGRVATDGTVTPDGYVVNTAWTVNTPHLGVIPKEQLVPNQTMPTIGDRLSDKNISWAWYSGGWDDAVSGRPAPLFQFHHQPFAYFAKYADGTPGRAQHLRDEKE